MRLFVSKTEAEWLLKATRSARDENNFNMKGIMGDLALSDLANRLLAQISLQTKKEKK